jgi:signal transduction histidine kinase
VTVPATGSLFLALGGRALSGRPLAATDVGLGLTVSRGLTEAMGGTLKPEETPGSGLTMAISLPARYLARASAHGKVIVRVV